VRAAAANGERPRERLGCAIPQAVVRGEHPLQLLDTFRVLGQASGPPRQEADCDSDDSHPPAEDNRDRDVGIHRRSFVPRSKRIMPPAITGPRRFIAEDRNRGTRRSVLSGSALIGRSELSIVALVGPVI
jgi:hypothetical protein